MSCLACFIFSPIDDHDTTIILFFKHCHYDAYFTFQTKKCGINDKDITAGRFQKEILSADNRPRSVT